MPTKPYAILSCPRCGRETPLTLRQFEVIYLQDYTCFGCGEIFAFLKASRVDTSGMSDNRYLYSIGRNVLADLLLASIYTGEFDEDNRSK